MLGRGTLELVINDRTVDGFGRALREDVGARDPVKHHPGAIRGLHLNAICPVVVFLCDDRREPHALLERGVEVAHKYGVLVAGQLWLWLWVKRQSFRAGFCAQVGRSKRRRRVLEHLLWRVVTRL